MGNFESREIQGILWLCCLSSWELSENEADFLFGLDCWNYGDFGIEGRGKIKDNETLSVIYTNYDSYWLEKVGNKLW